MEDRSGVRRRVVTAGVLVGRSQQCDIVLADGHASRSQALVYLGQAAPRLVVLGKGTTKVNGTRVDSEQNLRDGDVLTLPGMELKILAEALPREAAKVTAGWMIEGPTGSLFGVQKSPFAVGGGPKADLQIDGWPETTFLFHLVGGQLSMEAVAALEMDGEPVAPGAIETLMPSTVLTYGDKSIRVMGGGHISEKTTLPHGGPAGPKRYQVHLEFLPRGGRLRLAAGDEVSTLYLPDRRCDLVATLLNPPSGFEAGGLVPDEVVLSRVWPGRAMSRSDLNVLVHRLRKDLLRAGLDGPALVQRAKGGGATKFALAAGSHVTME